MRCAGRELYSRSDRRLMHSRTIGRIGFRRDIVSVLGAVCAACVLACRTLPDPNAVPAGASRLELSNTYEDSLECGRRDCVDWFVVQVPAKGELRIRVWPDPSTRSSATPSSQLLTATLIDMNGRVIARGVPLSGETESAEIGMNVGADPGTYRFSVEVSTPEVRGRILYRLSPEFMRESPPPVVSTPPPVLPRFATRPVPVIEVEGIRGGVRSLLLGQGTNASLEPCLRGKLFDGAKEIGEIEIVEVFGGASRARVIGSLRGEITSDTRAEVSVPLNAAAKPRCK